MFSSLVDIEAQQAIAEVLPDFKAAPQLAEELRKWLYIVFQQWKLEHGECPPPSAGGLLGFNIDFETAKPYQCANPPMLGYSGLALFLLSESYPPMLAVAQKVSHRIIIAGAVLVEANDRPVSELGLRRSLECYKDWRISESEILLSWMTPDAKHGRKFKEGRKPNAGGPVRKAIARLLKKNPAMKNPELWKSIKANPPRGWEPVESMRHGERLDGPTVNDRMGYGRFCTVCGEERKKAREKITG